MRDFHPAGARFRGFGWPPFPPRPPFPPGHGHRGHGHGRGRGGRRGNVRGAVLGLLSERPMHGYEMITELEARTGGAWRPSPGSVYPTLQMMEDEGLITSETVDGRKRFTLTETGRAAASEAGAAPWEQFDDAMIAEAQDSRQAMFGLMNAYRQVAFSGTDDQRARALEVLNEASRKLYGILADAE